MTNYPIQEHNAIPEFSQTQPPIQVRPSFVIQSIFIEPSCQSLNLAGSH